MVAIQLALCMQFVFSLATKLLGKASFKLEPQYERSVLPGIFWSSGEWGRHLGQGGVRNVRDY